MKHVDILFKVQKDTEIVNSKVLKIKMVNQWCYQNALYVPVKNQDLWNNKKQKDY